MCRLIGQLVKSAGSPCGLTGAILFLLCYPTVWLGARLGAIALRAARGSSGLFLIESGVKIFIEHLK